MELDSEDDSSNSSIAQRIQEVKSIDADMARASAKLASSQVKKELAAQTDSVAKQNPQIFLGLFENQ